MTDWLIYLDVGVLLYMIQSLCDSWQRLLELGGAIGRCPVQEIEDWWQKWLDEANKR